MLYVTQDHPPLPTPVVTYPPWSLPVSAQTYKGDEQLDPCQSFHEYFRGWLMSASWRRAAIKKAPRHRGPPKASKPPKKPSEQFFHFSPTTSWVQHNGQRPRTPARCLLLLRVHVARTRRGLLVGDALGGFHPENPRGEGPGERLER